MLTEIAPIEAWFSLEKTVHERFSMNAAVFNEQGIRLTDFMNWGNPLCPGIKSNDKGKTYICAAAHQNLAASAAHQKRSIAEPCDAGMTKVVVPIFKDGVFIGAAGGCGVLSPGNEVDCFYIGKVTGIREDECKPLIRDVKRVPHGAIAEVIDFIEHRVSRLVNGK